MSTEYFSGRVHSVIFNNAAEDFYIARLVLDSTSDSYAAVGDMFTLDDPNRIVMRGNVPGMKLEIGSWVGFEGKWVNHPQYGRQVQVVKAPVIKQWSSQVALTLLASNEVGPRVCKALEVLGNELVGTLNAGDEARIASQCEGVSEFQAAHVVATWKNIRAYYQTIGFLNQLGINKTALSRIWSHFGDDAEEVLSQNPWRMVEIDGITFPQADEAARRLGLDMSKPERMVGAVLYVAKSGRGMGHLYLTMDAMLAQTQAYVVDAEAREVAKALGHCHKNGTLVIDRRTKPGTTAIYEPWLYELEVRSARLLKERVTNAAITDDAHVEEYARALASAGSKAEAAHEKDPRDIAGIARAALEDWGSTSKMDLSEHQLEGALNALTAPVSILTGLPGTGKCVVKRTLVGGPWGMAPIGRFLPGESQSDQAYPLELELDTSLGVRKTAYVYDGGISPTIRVRTSSGYELEGTPEHPIRVIRAGEITWARLDQLSVGDVPLLMRGGRSFPTEAPELPTAPLCDRRAAKWKFPKRMDTDLAALLGYLVAEGSVADRRNWQIAAHEAHIQEFLHRVLQDKFGINAQYHLDARYPGHPVGIRFNSVQIVSWFRLLGLGADLADGKKVPDIIFKSPRAIIASFLRAYFEGDGSVDPKRLVVEAGTCSEQLAYEVHNLLLAMGIVSSRICTSNSAGNPFHRVIVSGEDYDRFRSIIGFHFTDVPERDRPLNTNRHLLYECKPLLRELMREVRPKKGSAYNQFYRAAMGKGAHHREVSREHLESLLAQATEESATTAKLRALARPEFFYDPIAEIDYGHAEVVDFNVPGDHEFISGGFISHNTTTLLSVVRTLQNSDTRFLLVAPTGIAAKRMASVVGAEASTIHRAFGAKGKDEDDGREATYTGIVGESSGKVARDGSADMWDGERNPSHADVVICDESSMVDQHLLYRILTCTKPSARLVFVGDHAQLPSVGPGNVLRELIYSDLFPTVSLTEIYRQGDTSQIVTAAHAINAGEIPAVGRSTKDDFILVQKSSEDENLDVVLKLADTLYRKRRNFQVISPRHAGTLGVTNLNSRLRELLNPQTQGLQEIRLGKETLREGDRVMVVKNDYDLGIFNGDVGKVSQINRRDQEVVIKIHGPPAMNVSIPFKKAPSRLRLAYGMTVHKCVHPDTLVETHRGLLPIRDIPEEGEVAGPNGPRPYLRKVVNPEGPAIRIRTRGGYSLTVTPDHGVDVWDGEGYVRREAADIREGDVLRLRLGSTLEPTTDLAKLLPEAPVHDVRATAHRIPSQMDADVAEFLGLMVAGGTLYPKGFRLAKRHTDTVDRFADLCQALFGVEVRRHHTNGADHAEVNSTFLSAWLAAVGGLCPHAKTVPECVLRSPSHIQARFLRGLFADGGVNIKGGRLDHIEWTCKSDTLPDVVRTMLLRFGIPCDTTSNRGIHTVYVYGRYAQRFGLEVGFPSEVKRARLRLPCGDQTKYFVPVSKDEALQIRKDHMDVLGHSTCGNTVQRGRLSLRSLALLRQAGACSPAAVRLLERASKWHHEPVVAIEGTTCPSMCVEVPDGHQFFQNGFSGWNCQGQEYDVIVLPVVKSFSHQLQRNLLYTAITRAKKKVIMVGHQAAFARAILNNRIDDRNTLFQQRLHIAFNEDTDAERS